MPFVFHKFTIWPQNWYGNTGDPEQSKESWKRTKLEYSQFPLQNWPQYYNNQECLTVLAQGDNYQSNRIESRNTPSHFIFKVPKALNVGSTAFNNGAAASGHTYTKEWTWVTTYLDYHLVYKNNTHKLNTLNIRTETTTY